MVRRVFLRSPRLRTTGLTVLLSCAAACLIFTTAAQNPAATGVDSIRADELRQKLTYIASEKFKGRGNGTPELNQAAEYIASIFSRNGLKPAGDDGGFYQRFDVYSSRLGTQNDLHIRNIGGAEAGYKSRVD